VAEYVVTGLHALWARTPAGTPLGPIAVVGFGQIGRRVTRLLRALGHDVRVSDPILASKVQSAAGGADDPLDRMLENERFLSLEAAMRGARAITLHVPLTHDGPHSTVHLLDEPRCTRPSTSSTSRGCTSCYPAPSSSTRAVARWS